MTRRELGPTQNGETPREQRLAAAGRVAAGLLHDFRNQLGIISNLAFVLERQADDANKVRELARKLAELSHARTRVIDRIRDFLRQDAARFPDEAVLDLSAVVREMVALCTTLVDTRDEAARIRFACDASVTLEVAGDGADLRTAVFEVLRNAMDASPPAGVVEVRTGREGALAILQVRDSGRGVPEGMAEMAFDPFISTQEDPGAGLGLAAAWGIARRHGGELSLATAPSGGTMATLSLPLMASD